MPDGKPARRVLIVDDHPDAAQALAMLVRLLGYECMTATSGGEAIAHARATDFDLAIIDIGLPDVSGRRGGARAASAALGARSTSRRSRATGGPRTGRTRCRRASTTTC